MVPARDCAAPSFRRSTKTSKRASPCSPTPKAVSSSINSRRNCTSCAHGWSVSKTAHSDELDVSAGDSGKSVKLTMQPAKDLLAQRTGASLFGMLKIEDEEQRMSFKMSCTYCHQVGTLGLSHAGRAGRLASHDHAHGRLRCAAPGVEENDRQETRRHLRRGCSQEVAQVDSARSAQGQGAGLARHRVGHGLQAADDDPRFGIGA